MSFPAPFLSLLRGNRLRRAAAAGLLAWLGSVATLGAVAGDPALTFVGVALDAETARADEKLRAYLRAKERLRFEPRDMEYGAAIDTLVRWNVNEKGPLMARVTPYVYVLAEMLGANLDILGTYVSKRTRRRRIRATLSCTRRRG